VSYTIVWKPQAVAQLRRLREQDREAVKPVLAAVAAAT
jgi:mRNA-degrading endonuclease RelE of RelBE toxin-antitoxin system